MEFQSLRICSCGNAIVPARNFVTVKRTFCTKHSKSLECPSTKFGRSSHEFQIRVDITTTVTVIGGGIRPSGCRSVVDGDRPDRFLKRILPPSAVPAYSSILLGLQITPLLQAAQHAKKQRNLRTMINQYDSQTRGHSIGQPSDAIQWRPHNSKRSTYAFFFYYYFAWKSKARPVKNDGGSHHCTHSGSHMACGATLPRRADVHGAHFRSFGAFSRRNYKHFYPFSRANFDL